MTLSELQRKAQDQSREIKEANVAHDKLKEEVHRVDGRIDDADMKTSAKFEEMNAKLGAQRRQFDDLNTSLADTRNAISDNPDKFNAIQQTLDALEAGIADARGENVKTNDGLEALGSKFGVVDKMQKEIMTLMEEASVASRRVTSRHVAPPCGRRVASGRAPLWSSLDAACVCQRTGPTALAWSHLPSCVGGRPGFVDTLFFFPTLSTTKNNGAIIILLRR